MVRILSFQSHGLSSVLGQRTEIPQAMQHGQTRRKERETERLKFNLRESIQEKNRYFIKKRD